MRHRRHVKPGGGTICCGHTRAPRGRPRSNSAPRTPSGPARGRAGERTNAMCSVPSSRMSSRNSPAPGEEPRVLAAADRPAERADDSHAGEVTTWKAVARGEAAALPPPRRRADRVPRGRDRAAAGAAALAGAHPPRVRAGGGRARPPPPRRAARPAAARRQRGPPAPPLHAGVADRGARRLPARHVRAAAAASPATASARSSRCGRSRTGALAAVAARAAAELRCTPSPRAAALERAGRVVVRAAVVPGRRPRARARRRARPAARAAATA